MRGVVEKRYVGVEVKPLVFSGRRDRLYTSNTPKRVKSRDNGGDRREGRFIVKITRNSHSNDQSPSGDKVAHTRQQPEQVETLIPTRTEPQVWEDRDRVHGGHKLG